MIAVGSVTQWYGVPGAEAHARPFKTIVDAMTLRARVVELFEMAEQALQILPLFAAAHVVALLVRMLAGAGFPGWGLVLAPVFESLMWPLVTMVMLAPQRRPPDRDKNRPL